MELLKTVIHKLFVVVIALIFAAGCATVTDANVDLNEEPSVLPSERMDNLWDSTTGDTMGEIIIRPDMGE